MPPLTPQQTIEILATYTPKIMDDNPDGTKTCPGQTRACYGVIQDIGFVPLVGEPECNELLSSAAATIAQASQALFHKATVDACAAAGLEPGMKAGCASVEMTAIGGAPMLAFVRKGAMVSAGQYTLQQAAEDIATAAGLQFVAFQPDGIAGFPSDGGEVAWSYSNGFGHVPTTNNQEVNEILKRTAGSLQRIVSSILNDTAATIADLLAIDSEVARLMFVIRDGRPALGFVRTNLSLVPAVP